MHDAYIYIVYFDFVMHNQIAKEIVMMMKNVIHPLHVLVVLVFLLCMNTSLSSASKHSNFIKCIEREREALLLFRQGVANEYDQLDSWNKQVEEDCCNWKGVGCNNGTGHVTHLLLSSLLSPTFTDSPRVTIGHSLFDLPYLTYLDLSSNNLSRIPDFVGSFRRLVHLDFSYTWPGGSVPSQIRNLSNLQYLDLSFNFFYLNGPIPIPNFIGSLNNLRYLDLSHSGFTGVIPHKLGNLSKLHHLDLGYNYGLSGGGNFNWLFNLSSLTHIDLSGIEIAPPSIWASLIERIPSISFMNLEICNLSALSTSGNFSSSISTLNLRENHIDSSIFDWISHLSGSLVKLDLRYNVLEGRIPESFGHMTSLTHLNLGGNLLNGPIPQSFGHMTSLTHLNLGKNLLNGPIPQSFGHMTSLTHLYLEYNNLTGPIPNTFALMTALTYLDLSANQLHGVIPKSFGKLSSLQVADFSSNNFTGNLEDFVFGPFPLLRELHISTNQLTGSLPDITLHSNLIELRVNSNQLNGYLPTVFKNYSALQVLDLSNNHIRGSLPDFTESSSLESLHLDNNEFVGSIPDFTGLSSLASLSLSNNEFTGSIPDFTGCSSLIELQLGENQLTEWETHSIGLLYNLRELGLEKNSIHSTITEAHLSNLSNLVYMSASYNSMTFDFSSKWIPPFQLFDLSLATCKLGPKFPNWIQNQREINHLDISNSQISDTIPLWFWNLSSIQYLNLSSNKIAGRLSSKLNNVIQIDLSSNHFDGPLPPFATDCSKINLSQNKFSGTLISLSVVEYLSLGYLDISHNQLSSALPDNWRNFRSLVFLNLGYNNFFGRIPTSIGHLVSLRTLILRKNKLYGELPVSLRNCSSLGFADLGLNNISGKIPSWIGDQPQLYALILKSNRFHGSMPYKICHLSNLHFLDLSINRISGTIPPCFGNLTAMIRKETDVVEHTYNTTDTGPSIIKGDPGPTAPTSSYIDNVLARWKGQEFEYGKNFAYLKMIDLSSNELTGEIPIGITRLFELKGLNLSGNRFKGKVPLEIGQLKELESLDLSANKFSGEIPQSMSGLNSLGYLNLSNNNFSGRIPSGTQLQTFNISTYDGNPGLCGKPLTEICPGDEPADLVQPSLDEPEVDEDDSEYERWLYVSVALGFSTTFWGFIGTLVLNRRWRYVYYLFLENMKENIYVATTVRIAKLQRKF